MYQMQRLLPFEVICVLQNLPVDRKSLVWTVEGDAENTTVTLTWSKEECHSADVNFLSVPMRKKAPSTIRRDKTRRENFLRNGFYRPSSYNPENISSRAAEKQKTVHKVSTLIHIPSQTDVHCVDVGIQTAHSPSQNTCAQTEQIQTDSKFQQTNALVSKNCTERATNTDNHSTFSASVQTDACVNTSVGYSTDSNKEIVSHCVSNQTKILGTHAKEIHDLSSKLSQTTQQKFNLGSTCNSFAVPETEKVLKERKENGKNEFLIKWKDPSKFSSS